MKSKLDGPVPGQEEPAADRADRRTASDATVDVLTCVQKGAPSLQPRGSPGDSEQTSDTQNPGEAERDDTALILWMLSLDALGRLEVAQGFADSVETLRHARRG